MEARNSISELVSAHYERYPYPDYPIYASGDWDQLESVDLRSWKIGHPVEKLWICGCGTIAPLMFARRNPLVQILATDLSRRSLRKARWRSILYGYHNLEFRREDLLESPYIETFDAIDAFGVLHHLEDPTRALRILATALKPSGVIRLMLYSEKSRGAIDQLRKDLIQEPGLDWKEAKLAAQKLGFSMEGDLSNKYGLADALLHPQVTVYSEQTLLALFHSVPELNLIQMSHEGNYMAFLRKIDL